MRTMLQTALALTLVACSASAADWPAFRGASGNGIAAAGPVPHSWSDTVNVKWKVELPRPGNGSPIVSNGAVLVTSALDKEGRQRSLLCYDRSDGSLQWERTVKFDRQMPTHQTNPYCGSTPAANGEQVVVWHGSAGLHCYDLDGTHRWSRDLGEFDHMWGYGTSPVLYGDSVIMHCSPGKRNFLAALDLDDGQTIWKVEEPHTGDGNAREDGKYMGSWCTPVLTQVDGREQLLCTMPTRLIAFDPTDGSRIWWCNGIRGPKGDLAYSSPIIADDLCVSVGGFQGPSIGLRMGGKDDITETHRVWRVESNPQSIGTAVYVDGYLYRPNAGPGTIDCLDPRTGEIIWTERGTGAAHWASIVYAGGHCYATDQDGTTVVFRPNPQKCEIVNTNQLGDPTNATPAISDGQLFLRTSKYLVCIGE